jgi:hypothetical protein
MPPELKKYVFRDPSIPPFSLWAKLTDIRNTLSNITLRNFIILVLMYFKLKTLSGNPVDLLATSIINN